VGLTEGRGETSLRICIAVSTQYTNVTDERSDKRIMAQTALCIASHGKDVVDLLFSDNRVIFYITTPADKILLPNHYLNCYSGYHNRVSISRTIFSH